ncbi:class I SAM-dependent methyltransferase [Methylovirgula sp. 4M-Z18]|uniref:class I SAM-dependent methyltransferase n=1 Tax=Methylovirgula sp. 4M-Z18 TaxID=2293567 RepID=UPI000E2F9AD6|nr:class I SAM-dependent methyltransferase [Methylovirgula sp. 4M-Z18]RFB80035.1 methyltransferase [Methylovirgula sp. 4M-Z18]
MEAAKRASAESDTQRLYDGVEARHKEWSVIASLDDAVSSPNRRLFEVSLLAIALARHVELTVFDDRNSDEPRWFENWPGEHYKLLVGLVRATAAKNIIEIGTYTGMGLLSLAQGLPNGGSITSFDIVPWDTFDKTWLRKSDFASGNVRQEIHDISGADGLKPYLELFETADFIFVDGPKDVATEAAILRNLETVTFKNDPIIMFDDIRVMNMVSIWRKIARPKLDLTSFGHWSGTGLIDWSGRAD